MLIPSSIFFFINAYNLYSTVNSNHVEKAPTKQANYKMMKERNLGYCKQILASFKKF